MFADAGRCADRRRRRSGERGAARGTLSTEQGLTQTVPERNRVLRNIVKLRSDTVRNSGDGELDGVFWVVVPVRDVVG